MFGEVMKMTDLGSNQAVSKKIALLHPITGLMLF